MSCNPSSPCGTWELRRTVEGTPDNGAGYGNQSWSYELIDRASGDVIASWNGSAHTSPWDGYSSGIAQVTWDGDHLRIEHCPEHMYAEPVVQRVLPATLVPGYSATDT